MEGKEGGQAGEERKEGRACLFGNTEKSGGLVGEQASQRASMPGPGQDPAGSRKSVHNC